MRFAWKNLKRNEPPDVYQWKVLPVGTSSSPCCATFTLQKHVTDHAADNEDIAQTLEESFYVDNCLRSLPTAEAAKWSTRSVTCFRLVGLRFVSGQVMTPQLCLTYLLKPNPNPQSSGFWRSTLTHKNLLLG